MKKGILTIAGMLLTVSLVSAGTTVPVLADEETTLVYGSGDYTRINPAMDEHGEINILIFNGLTAHDGDNQVVPGLAESWEFDDATNTYTFHMAEDAKWQDGEPVTADDVKFTIEATQEGHDIYDPCAPGSRMGTTRAQWDEAFQKNPELLDLLDGLHFHTLCEQDSDDLETTLVSVKKHFGDLAARVKWINFGGGHHITRPGYDVERLERCIRRVQEEWKAEVYLEPGEAWALNAGFLLTSVLDVLKNGETQIAIVDASAACHMPDVLEMPYLPPLLGTDETEDGGITVRLGGPTCLSGDVIGEYKFRQLPEYGDLLMFGDMAIYTTCKNNTFNGMPLPNIWLRRADNMMQQLTDFGYMDFKERLGSRE